MSGTRPHRRKLERKKTRPTPSVKLFRTAIRRFCQTSHHIMLTSAATAASQFVQTKPEQLLAKMSLVVLVLLLGTLVVPGLFIPSCLLLAVLGVAIPCVGALLRPMGDALRFNALIIFSPLLRRYSRPEQALRAQMLRCDATAYRNLKQSQSLVSLSIRHQCWRLDRQSPAEFSIEIADLPRLRDINVGI